MIRKIAEEVVTLVEEKNQAYGDAVNAVGPLLEKLYPNGINPEQYLHLGLIVRILDKVMRIAHGHADGAFQDIAGYGLLGAEMIRAEKFEQAKERVFHTHAGLLSRLKDD